MTLILTNEDAAQVLTMAGTIEALEQLYGEMVGTDEYRAAAMPSIDVSRPNSGDTLQRYVTTNLNLTSIPADTLTEYISILGTN